MADLLQHAAPPADAHAAATAAADAAGCVVADLHDLDELRAAAEVFSAVWARADGEQIVPLEMLRALTHAGNYAAGAFVQGRMVGAIAGFLGEVDGTATLHSHIMGLLPDHRGNGVGFALKQHQRAWALDRGLATVTWTFDPLVRANAHLNLTKLAAVAATYLADFYGPMTDELNAGEETDRLLVTWEVASARAEQASRGEPRTFDGDRLRDAGAEVLLDEDPQGRPVEHTAAADRLLCRVPRDIIVVRRQRPDLAHAWRHAVRDTLGAAIADGFQAVAVTASGSYLLERPDSEPLQ
jgi:predicted GNAT superfamily acetyltransferase